MDMLTDIINQVNANPKLGIAVKNNDKGTFVLPFSTLQKLKERGYDTVVDYLNNLSHNNNHNLTVYLKRKSGSSSVYIKDMEVKLQNPNIKAVANQGKEKAVAVESVAAPFSNNEQYGMLGVNPAVLDMYSKSQQFSQLQPQLASKTETIETLRAENNQMKLEKIHTDFEIKALQKQLEEKKRPNFSDEGIGMFSMIFEKASPILSALANNKGGGGGLNGAAQPREPTEIFSVTKTQLLEYIKNPNYTDANANYLLRIINNLNTPEFEKAIFELLNNQQQQQQQQPTA